MKNRILATAALALLLTFGYVPRQAPLSEYVGASAVAAQQCNRSSLCVWVNLVIYKFEFCVENEDCPQPA
jgi:hypothetical protein